LIDTSVPEGFKTKYRSVSEMKGSKNKYLEGIVKKRVVNNDS